MIDRLEGIIPAPFTPMNKDQSLNLGQIPNQISHFNNHKIKASFINGSTGEGLYLTKGERMEVLEKWMESKSEDFRVITHISHSSIKSVKDLVEHAEKCGSDGISSLGPFYQKPKNTEDLAHYIENICSWAPNTPFYYYHIPALSGVYIKMEDLLEAVHGKIPNFCGIKFTYSDLVDYKRCKDFADGYYDILFGNDELMICGLALGAKGFVGSSYNLFPDLYHKLIAEFEAGNIGAARKLQSDSINIILKIAEYGYSAAAKQLSKFIGIDCGGARLPLRNLDDSKLIELKEAVFEMGLGKYLSPNFDLAFKS